MRYCVQLFNFDERQPGREVDITAKSTQDAERKALDRFPYYDTASTTGAYKQKRRKVAA